MLPLLSILTRYAGVALVKPNARGALKGIDISGRHWARFANPFVTWGQPSTPTCTVLIWT
ncbi:MAG TPA: hypothetical protein VGA84_13810 [Thermoanaerobaculia bacterium]